MSKPLDPLSFSAFWHILTTSRYTRHLEEENAILRDECCNLRGDLDRLRKLSASLDRAAAEGRELPPEVQRAIAQRRRPGRFISFGAEKQRLESQEPPQRSVNV